MSLLALSHMPSTKPMGLLPPPDVGGDLLSGASLTASPSITLAPQSSAGPSDAQPGGADRPLVGVVEARARGGDGARAHEDVGDLGWS